ncbi:LOW QUALITY PROTEIN: putative defense protein 3 [Cololabis saira]|uniref:LOW QUALITY PROTEIN: putative defense protein 3 n=1 Tax=Cololabis saira TaxID=129043 RepID=UPI002AD40461|nr:LOW QUALITY PROTEIN: putative defense protein 3 [Cololabis saira]
MRGTRSTQTPEAFQMKTKGCFRLLLVELRHSLMEMLPGLIVLQLLYLADCYPNGAPTGACEDMLPRHVGVLPQPSRAPYALPTNMRTYQPGVHVTVTIVGPDYRGVLVTGASTNALGGWMLPPPDTTFLQCSGNAQGAVSHANTNLKGNSSVYTWVAPDTVLSPDYFMATVAQPRTVYWINVRSTTLSSEKLSGIGLATDASAGMADQKPFLLFLICFLLLQSLA